MDIKLYEPRYFDCICHDFDDVMRVWYEEDLGFSFEYRLMKFPQVKDDACYPHKPGKIWHNFWTKICQKYDMFRGYLRNVAWAVFGHPNWYTANTIMRHSTAAELACHIIKTLNEGSKDIPLLEKQNVIDSYSAISAAAKIGKKKIKEDGDAAAESIRNTIAEPPEPPKPVLKKPNRLLVVAFVTAFVVFLIGVMFYFMFIYLDLLSLIRGFATMKLSSPI